jgi:LPS-assembly lipoprotein
MRKLLLSVMMTLLISSCGFHLRGMQNAPTWLHRVAILNHSNNQSIESALNIVLDAYEIDVVENPKLADYWIVIESAGDQKHITSVGSGSNPRQYQLIYHIDYRLEKANGKIIKANKHITVSRQLTVNNNSILGSNQEADLMVAEMRQDAALKLINQLTY